LVPLEEGNGKDVARESKLSASLLFLAAATFVKISA